MGNSLPVMGNSNEAVNNLRHHIKQQDRTYAWLSRNTGIPYKRILAEIKNGDRPISLETAIASTEALGVRLPEIVEKSA